MEMNQSELTAQTATITLTLSEGPDRLQHIVNQGVDEQAPVETHVQLDPHSVVIDKVVSETTAAEDESTINDWGKIAINASADDCIDNFQRNIGKWEEFYDKVYTYLKNKHLPAKNPHSIEKAALSFTMDCDGNMFFTKRSKTGDLSSLPVVRSYEDRLRICRAIHLNTGVEGLHHRRDKMIELLGQQYYWKGQRRDACECIASCEMCSAGLGAKKRAKPPKQTRDVRPPAKLLKLAASPVGNTRDMSRCIDSGPMAGTVMSAESSQPTTCSFSGAPADTISHADFLRAMLDQDESGLESAVKEQSMLEDSPSTNGASSINLILQRVFAVPHQANPSILPAVSDAVYKVMQKSSDPMKLVGPCESYLKQMLGFGDRYSVIIAPSLAAAYITAVSAAMYTIDPLAINYQASISPLAVIHDACCQTDPAFGPIKSCTSLTGAFNLNLGSSIMPMDKNTLAAVLQSNRVAAIFHQPYSYLKHNKYVQLQVISSLCQARGASISIIVDASCIPDCVFSAEFMSTIQDFLSRGADAILLPVTEKLKGPPHTCVLIGKSSLLEDMAGNISALQSQVALPLTCSAVQLIGTVVAYQIFVSGHTTKASILL